MQKKVKQLAHDEEERIKNQKASLGPNGLTQNGKLIKAAIKSQKLPGANVLKNIPFGKADAIKFRSIKSYKRTKNQKDLDIQIDDVNSNFVQFYLFFKTEYLTIKQKMLLPLLFDLSEKNGHHKG